MESQEVMFENMKLKYGYMRILTCFVLIYVCNFIYVKSNHNMIEKLLKKNIINWEPNVDLVLPIVSIRDPNVPREDSILLKPSKPVPMPMSNADKEILAIFAQQMISTMNAEDGIGLAAVQVNIGLNMFVVSVTDLNFSKDRENDSHIKEIDKYGYYLYTRKPIICINPKIVYSSEEVVIMPENCLSVMNGNNIDVLRPKNIILHYTDIHGKKQILKATGWLARCIQHEYDHLLGKIIDVLEYSAESNIQKKNIQ